ncbi:MAG: efflux RND transporter periplasmic adaptor subunit [Cyclobacteriaceae bacterium]|nr:efflux RND transporter periplasmic adaptor subunit [Cyclobacteriaceae bacterium]
MKYSIISLSLLSLFACSAENKQDKQKITEVDASVILPISIQEENLKVSGLVKSQERAVISTRMMSEVKQVLVQAGDQVKQGDNLLLLDTQEIQAKVNQAKAMVAETQAALTVAEQDVNRYKALMKSNSVSVKENENIVLHYESLLAKHEAAKAMQTEAASWLKHAIIKAPFSGTIAQVLIDAGSITNPGMPLVFIEKNGAMAVQCFVDEATINKINVNEKVFVKAGDVLSRARISSKSNSSTANSGLYEVELSFEDNKQAYLIGQTVTVLFNVKNSKASVWLPKRALVYKDDQTGVFVKGGNQQAALRWVKTGLSNDSLTQILSGVQPNDTVLLSSNRLRNGVKVKLTK